MSDTPTPPQAAEKAEMPIIAYLRATKDEMPVWDGDDCVCQDPVYPSDPDGGDAHCISMPVVRLSDAESQLAELRAEVERLRKNDARYRWLREGKITRNGIEIENRGARVLERDEMCRLMHFAYWCSPAELDARIDAALAADGKDHHGKA